MVPQMLRSVESVGFTLEEPEGYFWGRAAQKFSVSFFLAQATSADFMHTHEGTDSTQLLWSLPVSCQVTVLSVAPDAAFSPSGNAIYSVSPKPWDSVCIASLLCVLLRFQCCLDAIDELVVLFQDLVVAVRREEKKEVKMKFSSLLLNSYLNRTAVTGLLGSVQFELPQTCCLVQWLCSRYGIPEFACFK